MLGLQQMHLTAYERQVLPGGLRCWVSTILRMFVVGRAEKHNCPNLKQTAIPLTATNFDRIDPEQLVLLTASDMKLLLASDQLSSTEVGNIFSLLLRLPLQMRVALDICNKEHC